MAFATLRDRRYFHGSRARTAYEFLGRYYSHTDHWRFMNYGYAFADPARRIAVRPDEEAERYNAQLYHIVAAQGDLAGKRVLDVGSGRGGGASYVHRYFAPRSTTGLDLAASAVRFCRRVYAGIEGLDFRVGNATDMPFVDDSFDAVVNVESAHCYRDRPAFFAEVLRVLRPGGEFLYTDFTAPGEAPDMALGAAGFASVRQRDVTAGIVRALTQDDIRRQAAIRAHVPFGLRWLGNLWSGRPGSWIYGDFVEGRRHYLVCHARKPLGLGKPLPYLVENLGSRPISGVSTLTGAAAAPTLPA